MSSKFDKNNTGIYVTNENKQYYHRNTINEEIFKNQKYRRNRDTYYTHVSDLHAYVMRIIMKKKHTQ